MKYDENKAFDLTNLVNMAHHVDFNWCDEEESIYGCQLFYTRSQLADIFKTTTEKVDELIISHGPTRFKTLEESASPKTSELLDLSKKYLHIDISLVDINDDQVEYMFYLNK